MAAFWAGCTEGSSGPDVLGWVMCFGLDLQVCCAGRAVSCQYARSRAGLSRLLLSMHQSFLEVPPWAAGKKRMLGGGSG